MKRIIFFILLFLAGSSLFAQPEKEGVFHGKPENVPVKNKWGGKCGDVKFFLDSVYTYIYNQKQADWVLYYRNTYNINKFGYADTVQQDIIPGYTPYTRGITVFNDNGGTDYYYYEKWVNGLWTNVLKIEYSVKSEFQTEALAYRWDSFNQAWIVYQKEIYYTNESGFSTGYLMQKLSSLNEWYDYLTRTYYYDEYNRIIKFSDVLSDGTLLREASTRYVSESNKISVSLTQSTGFLANGQTYTDSTKTYIEYDIWGNSTSQTGYKKVNSVWVPTSKTMSFYHIDPSVRKVTMCHNGKSICVSVNAVESHLKLGDYPGECDPENSASANSGERLKLHPDKPVDNLLNEIKVYPNPFNDVLNIAGNPVRRIEIYNQYGHLVYNKSGYSKKEIKLNLGHLERGTYYLRIESEDGLNSNIVILRN